MLSKKAKYGLQALIYLAKQPPQKPVLIAEMAEKARLPKKFLELILLELRNVGIVQSRKGKGGGYFLNRPAEKIALGTVVRLLNGPLAPVACASQTAYSRCDDCVSEETCGIHMVMKDVRDAMAKILDGTSLADVVARAENAAILPMRKLIGATS
ncbi:MAG: Rrf2 family transcriptional regulator [Candidatus Korobacteraceae bacterium]